MNVSYETIQNCFKTALAGRENAEPVEKQLLQEILGLNKLAISNIKKVMKINQYFNTVEEEVVDDLNDLDGIASNRFRTKDSESNDPNGEELPRITAIKFFECLSLIRLFEEQQVDGD